MKINLIRNNCSIPKLSKNSAKNTLSTKNNINYNYVVNYNSAISMRGVLDKKNKSEEQFCKDFMSKQGKTTPEECKDIIENHPFTLTQCHNICDAENELYLRPIDLAQMAIGLKNYYDNLYDKNYTIASIGRSPALISEVMQNLGAKVIFLPISNLRSMGDISHHPMRNIYPTYASRFENIDTLMKYATKKGIAKKDAGKILVLDYTHTGMSLDIMKKVLEERGDIPKENIIKRSLADDVEKARWNNCANISAGAIHALKKDLMLSNLAALCNVPFFDYDEDFMDFKCHTSGEIMKKFDNYSTCLGRAWALWITSEALRLQNLQTK